MTAAITDPPNRYSSLRALVSSENRAMKPFFFNDYDIEDSSSLLIGLKEELEVGRECVARIARKLSSRFTVFVSRPQSDTSC